MQVCLGEKTVILGALLGAHYLAFAAFGVVAQSFAPDPAATLKNGALARIFLLYCLRDEGKGVDILYLGALTERVAAYG